MNLTYLLFINGQFFDSTRNCDLAFVWWKDFYIRLFHLFCKKKAQIWYNSIIKIKEYGNGYHHWH